MKTLIVLLLGPFVFAFGQNIKVTDKLTQGEAIVSDNPDDLKEHTWYKFENESISAYIYVARNSDGLATTMAELEALLKLNKKSFKSPDTDESIGEFNYKNLKKAGEEMRAGGLYVKKTWLITPGDTNGDFIMIEFKTDLLKIEVLDVK